MTIDDPTVPVVACDVATVGFVVVVPPEPIVETGLDVEGGSAGGAAGLVEEAAVDVVVEGAAGVLDVEEGDDSLVVAVVVDDALVELDDEDEDDDEEDDEEEDDEDDEALDELADEEVLELAGVSAALSLVFAAAAGDAAERISGGVGTNRGAWRGSTCTVCPGREINVRSTPPASTEVTLCAPSSVWFSVSVPSRLARMFPEPRMPMFARFVFMWKRDRSRATMAPVNTRSVPVTSDSSASPAPLGDLSNS